MREKELRLALVCFGGVSLAIYMHGVTKEFLKLARASAAYHKNPDHAARRIAKYREQDVNEQDEIDTEEIYFDLLQAMGEKIDLRVIIDSIAGASAGGINGIFLSRALAHDLAYDPLRDLWLREADVTRLAPPPEPSSLWGKIFVDPLVRYVTKKIVGRRGLGPRVGEKLPALIRLRRMKPLFDGVHLVRLIYDALMNMGTGRGPDYSLMPTGHRLETFVTVTDFYGFLRNLPLHDPPMISEREHRHTFEFSFIHWRNGDWESDFDNDDVPGLAFAARSTASFPGAYPPAQLAEIESMLDERGLTWNTKDRFFVRNFADYLRAGIDPARTAFIDGSVLNNKPFAHAIRSIQGRPAYRQVDRRIVYIDPHPDELMPQPSGLVPSLWRTLKAALSDIPRNEPVHDDLNNIQDMNKRVRLLKSVIDAIKPRVSKLVGEIIAEDDKGVTADTVRAWRVAANARAAKDAGYSYEGYTRLKLQSAIRYLAGIVADICGFAWDSAEHLKLHDVLEVWVFRDPIDGERMSIPDYAFRDPASLPNWIKFLTAFDLDYQRRRIRYVVSEINLLYNRADINGSSALDVQQIDSFKSRFYDSLASMRRAESGAFVSSELRTAFHKAFGSLEDEAQSAFLDPAAFYANHRGDIDLALNGLSKEMGLEDLKIQSDVIFADLYQSDWPEDMVKDMLLAYLGFGFWDVITFSISANQDVGEFNEIKVDRVSPNDAKTLIQGDAKTLLKGVAMRHFGAFFSRKDRENDYLLGRLNAAERLIDILMDEAKSEGVSRAVRGLQAKKRAFAAILDTEEKYVPASASLIAKLREKLQEL